MSFVFLIFTVILVIFYTDKRRKKLLKDGYKVFLFFILCRSLIKKEMREMFINGYF